MVIGLVSYKFINNDIEFNISQIEKAVQRSKGEVDILCFGEAFLQGFDSLSWDYEKDSSIAITRDSSIMNRICSISYENRVDILIGYIEKDESNIYSSYAVIVNGSIFFNYRRISTGWRELIRENDNYKEGSSVKAFYYKDKKFIIALCGDLWEYPEKFKTDGILIWPIYVNFSIADWSGHIKDYARQAFLVSKKALMVSSISKNPDSVGGAFVFESGVIKKQLEFGKEAILKVSI